MIGDTLTLDVGAVAHGGHCVAHAPDGRVVFVRHALPGERVVAEVTEERRGYLRADAVSVLVAAPQRVPPPCPWVPRCGGCDFQHVDPAAQRELKAAVVAEQLARLAGLEMTVPVEELPGGALGWRTRVRYTVDAAGRAGLLAHRSHEVVPVDRCLHFKTAVTALDGTTLLVNPAWLDVDGLRGFELVPVPAEEPWAANVARVEPHIVAAAAYPRTAELIRRRGYDVRTVDVSEFAKAEGGVTCLSLLIDQPNASAKPH